MGFGIGDISDLIFGTKAEANTSAHSTLTPEQQAMLKQLLGTLDPTGGSMAAPYTGQLTADPNKLQGQSLAAMEQAAMNQVGPGSNNAVASESLKGIAGQTPADLQDYYKKAIVDPTMQTFNQEIMPAITQRFRGNAGYGSDRILQEGIAAGNATTGMGAQLAQAIENQTKNKIAASSALGTLDANNVQTLLGLQQGGINQRDTEQKGLSNQYMEFQRQQTMKQQSIDDILKALGIKATENITTVLPGQAGLLQGAANGMGQAAGAFLLA